MSRRKRKKQGALEKMFSMLLTIIFLPFQLIGGVFVIVSMAGILALIIAIAAILVGAILAIIALL